MRVECGACGKPYRNEAPLLVMGERDGKRTMVPPEPRADWWIANCKCHPTNPKIIETEDAA